MGVNKVILVGNVGKDPELKSLDNGTTIAKFSLATSDRRRKDADGKPVSEWHNIVCWNKLAEIVQQYVHKGDMIYIEGNVRTRSWDADGVRKYMTEVHCDQMEMLGSKDRTSGASANEAPPHGDDDYPF